MGPSRPVAGEGAGVQWWVCKPRVGARQRGQGTVRVLAWDLPEPCWVTWRLRCPARSVQELSVEFGKRGGGVGVLHTQDLPGLSREPEIAPTAPPLPASSPPRPPPRFPVPLPMQRRSGRFSRTRTRWRYLCPRGSGAPALSGPAPREMGRGSSAHSFIETTRRLSGGLGGRGAGGEGRGRRRTQFPQLWDGEFCYRREGPKAECGPRGGGAGGGAVA